jgi:Putative prokaryotic signal transducing protein
VFCPVCGDEYRSGLTRCTDCGVDLVESPPMGIEDAEPFELVTVLETGDQSQVAVARSMLGDAGIPCIARNERLQNLFGWGAIGTGYNVAMGLIRLQVLREDEATARELLATAPTFLDENDNS